MKQLTKDEAIRCAKALGELYRLVYGTGKHPCLALVSAIESLEEK